MLLFNENELPELNCKQTIYSIEDGDIVLFEHFFSLSDANKLMTQLINETKWRQDTINLYGKTHLVPRLTAWYGDADKPYTYSGIQMKPEAWTSTLKEIKQKAEAEAATNFTSVLLNYYRNGQDSMGWHRDNEKELGENPVIASVSFGQTRPFHLRHKFRKDVQKLIIPLTHGSLLIMKGATQHFWEHQVPKSAKPLEPRINLTFRKILV